MAMKQFILTVFGENTRIYKTLRRLNRLAQPPLYNARRLWHVRYYFLVNANASDLVIVTGADSSHYRSLIQFLSSLEEYEPNIKVVVFDLGLTASERQSVAKTFPTADLRMFDYSKYPSYFDIKSNAGEYAWKPVIVHDVLHEFRCCICWMDAGNLVTEPLIWVRKIVEKSGFYSPISPRRVSDWTHPKTLKLLGASEELLDQRNLSGGCVAVSFKCSTARHLISRWRDCALKKDCIAPSGSNRQNHRQDQAVLSVLAHQSGITRKLPTEKYGFLLQQDVD